MHFLKINGVFFQTVATIIGNFLTISYGLMFGITAPMIVLYQSRETPLESGPIGNAEASWITSYLCLGGLFGSLLFGYLADKWGRRGSLTLAGLLQILGWFGVAFSYNIFHIYLSRILAGVAGGAAFIVLPIYVAEIAEDHVRGSLGSYISTFRNLGIVIGFIIGSFVPYNIIPLIGFGFSVVFVMFFPFVQESPYYFLMTNDFIMLEKSLRWFRAIRTLEDRNLSRFQNEVKIFERLRNEEFNKKASFTVKDFTEIHVIKAFIIGFVLITTTQLCGVFAVLNYSSKIFQEAGSDLPPNVCAIILAVVQMLGAYISNLFVDKVGRKILISLTSLGAGLSLSGFGVYLYLQTCNYYVHDFIWLPLACLSLLIFLSHMGLYPLAFVVVAEIFPQKVKALFTTIFLMWLWFLAFISVKYYYVVVELAGDYTCMWIFAGFCFFESIFTLLFIPETRGKSLEEILNILGRLKT